jgi:hypothetical protein
MANFSIRVNGLDDVLKRFKSFPAKLQTQVKGELKLASEEVKRNAVKDAPGDVGKLRQSIVVNHESGTSSTVSVTVGYGGYIEWGTKKKARVPSELAAYAARFKGATTSPTGLKLNDAILAWVKRKGIGGLYSVKTRKRSNSKASKENMKQVAFLIASKIRKEGIKPRPYFFKNVFAVRDKLVQRILQMVKQSKI